MQPTYADEVSRIARAAASAVQPGLEERLVAVYGPQWLDTINQRRRDEGRAAGRGLGDHRFCLVLLAYDQATEGWVGAEVRAGARGLIGLANRAAHDDQLSQQDVARARSLAERLHKAVQTDQPAGSGGGGPWLGGADPARDATARLYEAGDLAGAEQAALEWLEREPDGDALACLVLIYARARRYHDLLRVAGQIKARHPYLAAQAATRAWFGLSAGGGDHWAQILATARDWTRLQPDDVDAWEFLALAARQLGDLPSRLQAANALVRLEPDQPRHLRTAAAVFFDAGRPSDMAQATSAWIAADPGSAEAHQWHIIALGGAQRDAEVIAHCERMWPRAAENPLVGYALLVAYNRTREYGKAVAIGTRLAAHPDCLSNTRGELAVALYFDGQPDAAEAVARQNLRREPDGYQSLYVLAQVLLDAERFAEALAVTTQLLAVDPGIPGSWACHVQVLLGLERYAEARDAAQTLVTVDPDSAFALRLLTTTYLYTRDRRVLEAARRWVALDPTSTVAREVVSDFEQMFTQ
jgi:tetratricopeptide (TPR) repeat protein